MITLMPFTDEIRSRWYALSSVCYSELCDEAWQWSQVRMELNRIKVIFSRHGNGSEAIFCSPFSSRMEKVCLVIIDTICVRKIDIWICHGDNGLICYVPASTHKLEESSFSSSRTKTVLAAVVWLSGWAVSPEVSNCCSANSNTALQEVLS